MKDKPGKAEKLIKELVKLDRDEQIFIAKFFMSKSFGIELYTQTEVQRVLRAAAEAYIPKSPILRPGQNLVR